MNGLFSGLTALLAVVFAVALLRQWRERRGAFRLAWAVGLACYGLGAAAELLAATGGWSGPLAEIWYFTGALGTAAWLGLGTALLLARTRFGYTFAVVFFFAGLITLLTGRKYPDAGSVGLLYFLVALVFALAIGVETWFANTRWPFIAVAAVTGFTVVGLIQMAGLALPAIVATDPASGLPIASNFPGPVRLLAPLLNIAGAGSLFFGAVFSIYEFMPKRRVLPYSLDPSQAGDQFLFNLLISPVAITVNFVASIPGAVRAIFAGSVRNRVPGTVLIALGAFVPTFGDLAMSRLGNGRIHELGLLAGVVCLFAGFVVSSRDDR